MALLIGIAISIVKAAKTISGGGGEGLNEWITPFIFMNDHVE